MTTRPKGVIPALLTHMFDNGKIDYDSIDRHVEFLIANGVHGIVPCGTTGQSPTISWEEHEEINKTVIAARDRANSKTSVIIGAGSNNLIEAVESTKKATEEGADATLHVTGYYNMPTQEGFANYFLGVADAASEKGVIIYNIPGRGHPLILPETMAALAKARKNIWGTKDSTGGRVAGHKLYNEERSLWRAIRREANMRGLSLFGIWSGDDPVTCAMMTDPEIRANGVISVWANVFPHVYAKMVEAILRHDYKAAEKIDNSLKELNGLVGVRTGYYFPVGSENIYVEDDNFRNPQPAQFVAYTLGLTNSPMVRSPMIVPPKEVQRKVGVALHRLFVEHEDYFGPITEFYHPQPSVADRLMEYKEVV
ncbi:MAG: 4-hydroxy-tetrahydrodipicolinate synthase [Candidatus Aenigmarchaeota archaeon]|nr:4-hydroxy-tetrahydrodipicolinate synthase [Candidatus Aenigmarchaeota archaeon]